MRKSVTDERNEAEAKAMLPVPVGTVELAELTPTSPAYLSWYVEDVERPQWEMWLRAKHPALQDAAGQQLLIERFAAVSEIFADPDSGEEREVRICVILTTDGKAYRTGSARVCQDLLQMTVATRRSHWPEGLPVTVMRYQTSNKRQGLCLMPPRPAGPKEG